MVVPNYVLSAQAIYPSFSSRLFYFCWQLFGSANSSSILFGCRVRVLGFKGLGFRVEEC